MPYKEFTLVTDGTEAMLQIDIEKFTLTALYFWADSVPVFYNEETGKETTPKTKPGNNPLFVHSCAKLAHTKRLLQDHLFLLDETDTDYNEDIKIIYGFLNRYNINYELNL